MSEQTLVLLNNTSKGLTANQQSLTIKDKKNHSLLGPNPLVSAAVKIFSSISQLNNEKNHYNPDKLRAHLIDQLHEFTQEALTLKYKQESLSICQYIVALTVDNKINQSHWGKISEWDKSPLMNSIPHHQAIAVELPKVIRKMCQMPQAFIDVLEFVFICRSIADYQTSQHASTPIHQEQESIYHTIQNYRGEFDKSLSKPSEKKHQATIVQSQSNWSLPFIILIAVIIIGFIFFTFDHLLSQDASSIDNQVTHLISN